MRIGRLFIIETKELPGLRWILNIPTNALLPFGYSRRSPTSPITAAQSPQFRFQIAQPRRERRALLRFSSRAFFGFLARARFRLPRFCLTLRPFRFPLRPFRCFRRLPHHRRILAERRPPLVVAHHVVAFHSQP